MNVVQATKERLKARLAELDAKQSFRPTEIFADVPEGKWQALEDVFANFLEGRIPTATQAFADAIECCEMVEELMAAAFVFGVLLERLKNTFW